MLIDELHFAARQRVVRLGLARGLAHEVEVAAVANGVQQRASLRPVVGQQDGGGQVLGIGIDGESEQHELDQRNADHHPERDAVAPHLDEFLHHHGAEASEGKAVLRAHGVKLSRDWSMRWMNTSSRPERIRRHSWGALAERRDGLLQPGGVLAADVQHRAKSHRLLHSRLHAQFARQMQQIRPRDRPRREPRLLDHLGHRAMRQKVAVGNVGQPVAALGFVHVMRRDEKGEPSAARL